MSRWATSTMVAIAIAVAPAWAFAQSTTTTAAAEKAADKAKADKPKTENDAKVASGDRKFMMDALKGGMAEVELGKLAAERASGDAVKQFGQRMVDDHGKAGEELKKLAMEKGLQPSAQLDDKHRKLRDRLAKLSGAEFDRAYVDEMVKDHRKDVKDFQREADKAKDADVKAWAAKTLPTLQDHLKQIEGIQAQLKGTPKAARQ